MSLIEIEKQAKALMHAHGVGHLGFEFDRGKRRLGATHILVKNRGTSNEVRIPQKITLSKHFAAILTMDEIRDVILHEIAHALTPHDGHGPAWKAMAVKVGAKPKRCAAVDKAPETPVKGYCRTCQKVTAEAHRLPLRVKWCSVCHKSGRIVLGHRTQALVWFKNGTKVPMSQMPQRYQREFNAAPKVSFGSRDIFV